MIRETSRTTSFSIRARQAPATPVPRRLCLAAGASPPVPCLIEWSTRDDLRRARGQRHFYNEQSWKCVSEASSAAALLHFGLHFALWFHIAVRDSTCRLTAMTDRKLRIVPGQQALGEETTEPFKASDPCSKAHLRDIFRRTSQALQLREPNPIGTRTGRA